MVYTEAVPLASLSPAGWASEALLEGGVPVRECWEAVMALHDQVGGYLSLQSVELTVILKSENEEERDFYADEAGVLVERWMRERDAIPAADVGLTFPTREEPS